EEATDVSDTLFTTVRLGKTTIAELGTQIGRVAPVANAFGLSFDEVGACMSLLTLSLGDTVKAATGFEALLRTIVRPSKEAADVAKRYGVELGFTALKSRGFVAILKDLSRIQQQSAADFKLLFSEATAYNAG